MAISSRRADRLTPVKSIESVQIKVEQRVIITSAYKLSAGMKQRRMGPSFITKIKGARCELVDDCEERSRMAIHVSPAAEIS